jgi:hypothetical protein
MRKEMREKEHFSVKEASQILIFTIIPETFNPKLQDSVEEFRRYPLSNMYRPPLFEELGVSKTY